MKTYWITKDPETGERSYKVPFRDVYTSGGLRVWLAETIYCLVVLKLHRPPVTLEACSTAPHST